MKNKKTALILTTLLVFGASVMLAGCESNNSISESNNNISENKCAIESGTVFVSDLGLTFDIDTNTIEYHPENCQLRFDITLKNESFEQLTFNIEALDIDGNTEYIGSDQPYVFLGSGIITDGYNNSIYEPFAINFNTECPTPSEVKCRLVFENKEHNTKVVSTPFIIDVDNKTCTIAQTDESETIYNNAESEYKILSNKLTDIGKNEDIELLNVYGNSNLGYFAIDSISDNTIHVLELDDTEEIDMITDKYELYFKRSDDKYRSSQYNIDNMVDSFFKEYEDNGRKCTVQWYILDNGIKSVEMQCENEDGGTTIICLDSTSLEDEQFKDIANTIIYSYTRFNFDETFN